MNTVSVVPRERLPNPFNITSIGMEGLTPSVKIPSNSIVMLVKPTYTPSKYHNVMVILNFVIVNVYDIIILTISVADIYDDACILTRKSNGRKNEISIDHFCC